MIENEHLPPEIGAGAKVMVKDACGNCAEGEVCLKAPHDPEMARLKS